nr:MAG TPA: hypothetical protein [Caudoviricetes sp.]
MPSWFVYLSSVFVFPFRSISSKISSLLLKRSSFRII